jgi:hypothetical protein
LPVRAVAVAIVVVPARGLTVRDPTGLAGMNPKHPQGIEAPICVATLVGKYLLHMSNLKSPARIVDATKDSNRGQVKVSALVQAEVRECAPAEGQDLNSAKDADWTVAKNRDRGAVEVSALIPTEVRECVPAEDQDLNSAEDVDWAVAENRDRGAVEVSALIPAEVRACELAEDT